MVLSSLEQAQRLAQVPGVVVPDAILQRLAGHASPADQAKVGQDIAVEQVRWVAREGWSGIYLISPGNDRRDATGTKAGLR